METGFGGGCGFMSVSFIIPAFNEYDLIADAIGSVRYAAISAGIKDPEIIVVDNNSTDGTGERAKGLGAQVIVEKRKGVTRARQAGLEASSNEIVAFIDADNMIPSDWVKYALLAINKDGVVAASGPVVYRDLKLYKRVISFLFYLTAKVAHQFFPMVQGGNFVLRKSAFHLAGGFNTNIDFYGEDTDIAVRASKVGKVVFDLDMWAYSSSRRMEAEGFATIGLRYIVNWASVWILGRPWTESYRDWRDNPGS
jgi:glycosyltransferase involved in cell wall biosynthesis